MHTDNLIENLDIKSIFQLLQNQIAKTEELHIIIREKDQQIFQLQREIEESRIIGAFQRQKNCEGKIVPRGDNS